MVEEKEIQAKKEEIKKQAEEIFPSHEEKTLEKPTLPNLPEMYDKIKAENDRYEDLIKRQEELVSRKLLGGETNAGDVETKEKEESPADYVKRITGGQ